jgi:hypothetical protein
MDDDDDDDDEDDGFPGGGGRREFMFTLGICKQNCMMSQPAMANGHSKQALSFLPSFLPSQFNDF